MADNLVMISVDDLFAYQKFRHTFGVEIMTPNMDRLAGQGTIFDNAYAATPLCGPSRAAILTGQTPFETGIMENVDYYNLDRSELLPTILHDAGMTTALFGKIFHSYPEPEYAEGMLDITEEPSGIGNKVDGGAVGPGAEDYADFITIQNAIDMLNDHAGDDTPFALMAGLRRPHLPWIVPQEYYDLYPVEDIVAAGYPDDFFATLPPFALQFLKADEPNQSVARAIQGYLASVTFADAQIGRLLDTLDAQGLWDTTTVVLWSDHGYHLGDHDNWGKFTLWEEAANAPLIIVDPDQDQAGVHVDTAVSLSQIFATLTDLLGLATPASVTNPSFAGLIDSSFGPYTGGPVLTTVFGSLGMRWGDLRFIRYEDGSVELYDLSTDPGQTINLAVNPAQAALVTACLDTLRAAASAQGALFDDVSGELTGGTGDDRLIARNDVTHATGGDGDDIYFINQSIDVVEETDGGFDTAVLRAGSNGSTVRYVLPQNVEGYSDGIGVDLARIRGNAADNTMIGSDGRSIFQGLDGHDNLQGGKGDDNLFGGSGADTILGGADNDLLLGGRGNDLLKDVVGSDVFHGGKGDDRIASGVGPDRIIFRPNDGADMIADFSVLDGRTPLAADFDPSKDVLVFDGFAFANAAEVLAAFSDFPDGAVLVAEGFKLTLWGISATDLTAACIELIPPPLDL